MKQSRKMVLISEDEYAQLQARTKPTEDVTESSVREHNNTEIGLPSEISTKPSEVSGKSNLKLWGSIQLFTLIFF